MRENKPCKQHVEIRGQIRFAIIAKSAEPANSKRHFGKIYGDFLPYLTQFYSKSQISTICASAIDLSAEIKYNKTEYTLVYMIVCLKFYVKDGTTK